MSSTPRGDPSRFAGGACRFVLLLLTALMLAAPASAWGKGHGHRRVTSISIRPEGILATSPHRGLLLWRHAGRGRYALAPAAAAPLVADRGVTIGLVTREHPRVQTADERANVALAGMRAGVSEALGPPVPVPIRSSHPITSPPPGSERAPPGLG